MKCLKCSVSLCISPSSRLQVCILYQQWSWNPQTMNLVASKVREDKGTIQKATVFPWIALSSIGIFRFPETHVHIDFRSSLSKSRNSHLLPQETNSAPCLSQGKKKEKKEFCKIRCSEFNQFYTDYHHREENISPSKDFWIELA